MHQDRHVSSPFELISNELKIKDELNILIELCINSDQQGLLYSEILSFKLDFFRKNGLNLKAMFS
jgi:hypothetical protein